MIDPSELDEMRTNAEGILGIDEAQYHSVSALLALRVQKSDARIKLRLLDALQHAESESEQLRTQLAGCGVAALGGTKDPAQRSDYGWSPSYQDTLNLRFHYEAARGLVRRALGVCFEVASLFAVWTSDPYRPAYIRRELHDKARTLHDDADAFLYGWSDEAHAPLDGGEREQKTGLSCRDCGCDLSDFHGYGRCGRKAADP